MDSNTTPSDVSGEETLGRLTMDPIPEKGKFESQTSLSKSEKSQNKHLPRWKTDSKKASSEATLPKQEQVIKKMGQSSLDNVVVKEFIPNTNDDPILPILRELFVRSFDDYYKEIEDQLKLRTGKTLIEWLKETFDEMEEEMLTKKCRCFILCPLDKTKENSGKDVVGFLTLKNEEKGSVYIAQCAIDADCKRRGYGARLLQHLRNEYPPGTFYWGLCRRANKPAVSFYLKMGAKFMEKDEVATKYGYDPDLYAGFQLTDPGNNLSKDDDDEPLSSTESPIRSATSAEKLKRLLESERAIDKSTMTEPLLDSSKRKSSKQKSSNKKKCCCIS